MCLCAWLRGSVCACVCVPVCGSLRLCTCPAPIRYADIPMDGSAPDGMYLPQPGVGAGPVDYAGANEVMDMNAIKTDAKSFVV